MPAVQGAAPLEEGCARAGVQGRPARLSGEERHPRDARGRGAHAACRRGSLSARLLQTAFTVVIPARMRSTRLPGKMLADVAGKPLVAWTAERARASGASRVVVATDHADIERAVRALGVEACMTAESHQSGTDRIAEAARTLGLGPDEIVVNVQGDEPLIDPYLVRRVADELAARPEASIATAAHRIHDCASFFN